MAQLDRHTVAQFCLTDDRLLGAGVGTGGEVMLRAAMPGLLGFLWSMNSDVQLRSWVDDFFQYGRGRLGHYDSYRVAKETCVASMGKGYRCTRTFYSYDLVHSTPWGPKRGAYDTPKHVLYACIATVGNINYRFVPEGRAIRFRLHNTPPDKNNLLHQYCIA